MISSIYFDKDINNNLDRLYLFDDKIVDYICLKNMKNKSVQDLESIICQYINVDNVIHTRFLKKYKQLLGTLNLFGGKSFVIALRDFCDTFQSLLLKGEIVIKQNISSWLNRDAHSMFDLICSIFALDKIRTNKNDLYYESLFYYFFYNTMNNKMFDDCLANIADANKNIYLKHIIDNQIVVEILRDNGFDKVGDLQNIEPVALFCLASLDFDSIFLTIDSLKYNFIKFDNIRKYIQGIFSDLDEKYYYVIKARYGYFGEEKTLESIGNTFGLTRERVRQIEVKIAEKLYKEIQHVKVPIISLFNELKGNNRKYLSYDSLKKFFKDDELLFQFLYVLQIGDLAVKYDSRLKIVYDIDIATPEDFAKEILDTFGNFIDKAYVDRMDYCEKTVLMDYCRLYKDSVYLKRGLSSIDLMLPIIEDVFENGYKIYDENSFSILCHELQSRYGSEYELPTMRAFDGKIAARIEMCQVDRGLYKSRRMCATLPEELINRIVEFISVHSPVCQYLTIYEEFKNELNSLGINNYYYLKGLIDVELPNEFKTQRNYIQTTKDRITSNEAIVNYMKSFTGVFTLDDIKNGFKGVKDYTIYNCIYSEVDNSQLLFMNYKRFVYLKNLSVSESDKQIIKGIIDNLFESLGEKAINARKVFARLSLLNKHVLDNIKVIKDYEDLFGLLKVLFSDEYGLRRPFVFKNKDEKYSTNELIYNFANKLEAFNKKTLNDYINKMNIGGIYSYLDFMDNMSENYVQINVDTMVRKEKIAINDNQLNEICNMLNLIINKYESIDTAFFNGYIMFPKLSYAWNKYLLVGIIRSYLYEKFEIENKDVNYDSTDFIIRRIKNNG